MVWVVCSLVPIYSTEVAIKNRFYPKDDLLFIYMNIVATSSHNTTVKKPKSKFNSSQCYNPII